MNRTLYFLLPVAFCAGCASPPPGEAHQQGQARTKAMGNVTGPSYSTKVDDGVCGFLQIVYGGSSSASHQTSWRYKTRINDHPANGWGGVEYVVGIDQKRLTGDATGHELTYDVKINPPAGDTVSPSIVTSVVVKPNEIATLKVTY